MCQPRTQGSVLPVPTERERTWELGCTCIWLNPRAGKVKRILCSDWLSERARSAHLAGPSCVGPARKMSLFGYFINPLLTKFVSSRWLVLACSFFRFLLSGFTGKSLVFWIGGRSWRLIRPYLILFGVLLTYVLLPLAMELCTVPSPLLPSRGKGMAARLQWNLSVWFSCFTPI